MAIAARTTAPARATVVTAPPNERTPLRLGRIAAWAALVCFILFTILPFYWMIRTGLSNNRVLAANSGSLLPADVTLGAFQRVLGMQSLEEALAEGGSGASINFWLYLRNSLVVTSVITAGQVLFSAMAAYAFARLRWPGRDKLFFAFLTALMVPPVLTALPNFLTVRSLGLLNTLPGIMLPFLFMTPFAVFFLRQFFLTIPREIEEAARLDGAGHVRVFFRVMLPMSSAPIATLSLLVFITAWNEYLWPLLVAQDESTRVLTVALGIFRQQTPQGAPDWAGLMAATLIAALPVVVLFVIFGRRIVNSIGFSGIK